MRIPISSEKKRKMPPRINSTSALALHQALAGDYRNPNPVNLTVETKPTRNVVAIHRRQPATADRYTEIPMDYFNGYTHYAENEFIVRSLTGMLQHYPSPVSVNGTPRPTATYYDAPTVVRTAFGPPPHQAAANLSYLAYPRHLAGPRRHADFVYQGVTYPVQNLPSAGPEAEEVPRRNTPWASNFVVPSPDAAVNLPHWQGLDTVTVYHYHNLTHPEWLNANLIILPFHIDDTARLYLCPSEAYTDAVTEKISQDIHAAQNAVGALLDHNPQKRTWHEALTKRPIAVADNAKPIRLKSRDLTKALQQSAALALYGNSNPGIVPVADDDAPYQGIINAVTISETDPPQTSVYLPGPDAPRFITPKPCQGQDGWVDAIHLEMTLHSRRTQHPSLTRIRIPIPVLTDGERFDERVYLSGTATGISIQELDARLQQTYLKGESDQLTEEWRANYLARLTNNATYLLAGPLAAQQQTLERSAENFYLNAPPGNQEGPEVTLTSLEEPQGSYHHHHLILTRDNQPPWAIMLELMLAQAGIKPERRTAASALAKQMPAAKMLQQTAQEIIDQVIQEMNANGGHANADRQPSLCPGGTQESAPHSG